MLKTPIIVRQPLAQSTLRSMLQSKVQYQVSTLTVKSLIRSPLTLKSTPMVKLPLINLKPSTLSSSIVKLPLIRNLKPLVRRSPMSLINLKPLLQSHHYQLFETLSVQRQDLKTSIIDTKNKKLMMSSHGNTQTSHWNIQDNSQPKPTNNEREPWGLYIFLLLWFVLGLMFIE